MTVYVCDWTHWQGVTLPASTVEDEGYGMVKLKAGGSINEGRYFEDPRFLESAAALLKTEMIPAAYWYLMPGRPAAQAGLFWDLLRLTGDAAIWVPFLDVEQTGLSWRDVQDFAFAWYDLSGGTRLPLYTREGFWSTLGHDGGAETFPVLEEAHWVAESVRQDPNKPYASQQAKAIDPEWWHVNYGGWTDAHMLQFTDNALVAGQRTVATIFPGTEAELYDLLILSR